MALIRDFHVFNLLILILLCNHVVQSIFFTSGNFDPYSVVYTDDCQLNITTGGEKVRLQISNESEFSEPPHRISAFQQTNPPFGSELFPDSLMTHDDRVTSVRFSPKGTILASASWDTTIKLWNVSIGQRLELPDFKHSERIGAIDFSPDGRYVAATGNDAALMFWDIGTAQLTNNFQNVGSRYFQGPLEFSPRGERIAMRGDMFLRLVNTTNGEVILTLPDSSESNSVSFSPDGQLLASGHSDSSLKLWNVTTGEILPSLPGHDDAIYSVDFSPDGLLLASASRDGIIKLWNMTSRTELKTLSEHTGNIHSIAFSPTGTFLASGGEDTTIRFWNTTSGKSKILEGHTAAVYSIDFSPDGTLLASGSGDKSIKLWNMVEGVEVHSLSQGHTQDVNSLSFLPDGTTLVSGGNDKVVMWNLNTTDFDVLSNGQVSSIVSSPDNSLVVTGGEDKFVYVWDRNSPSTPKYNLNNTEPVKSVAFSADGTYLASSAGNIIKLWNMTDGQWLFDLTNHTDTINSIAFSPTSNILSSGSKDHSIKLWNITNKQLLYTFTEHNNWVNSVVFSPDGRLLASGSRDTTVKLWNLENKSILADLSGHSSEIFSLDFSPAGDILASSSYVSDGTIRLWNTTGIPQWLYTFPKEEETIRCVTFSPNGTTLASAIGSTINLWKFSPIPEDIDSDGMPDAWELSYGLDHGNFWDKFTDLDTDGLINSLEYFLGTNVTSSDSDGDLMPDGWEYLMGLNPLLDDATADLDNDGMPNGWEYSMNLHAGFNDAASDADGDGMPNSWEFIHGFDARNPADAAIDSDGDWISNKQEFQGHSDPHNFWSVPLISLSILHAAGFLIILILGILLALIFINMQRKALITRFDAPNYIMAKRIKNAELSSYSQFLEADAAAKEDFEAANRLYFHGDLTPAMQQYEAVLQIFMRLENIPLVAEVLFKICQLKNDLGDLSLASTPLLSHLPSDPQDKRVEAFGHMIQALLAENGKDWKIAEQSWQSAIRLDSLDIQYYRLCSSALVELEVKQWLNNPKETISQELIIKLEDLERVYITNHYFSRLCALYLLQVRIALASFFINEVDQWFTKCEQIANQHDMGFYKKAVQLERKRFQQYKQRITAIMQTEKIITPERQMDLYRNYLQEAVLVRKEFEGDSEE